MPPFFFAMSRPHILSDLRPGLGRKFPVATDWVNPSTHSENLSPCARMAAWGPEGFASCMDLRKVFATSCRLRYAKELSQGDLAYEAEISCIYLVQLKKGTYFVSLKIRRQPRH